jgi:hypothetical protein
VGQVGINLAPFGEPASRFTSAIERSGKMEEGKIATACQFLCDSKKSINVYKERVLP